MRVLVVGYGSIGARHARLAAEMGHDVACVTANGACPHPVVPDVASAVAKLRPGLVVVANRTADHLETLQHLAGAGYAGAVLVEKPVFAAMPETLPELAGPVFVGYNFRLHPVLGRARAAVAGRDVLAARFHVGQYLPDWRPGTDYRACYSASRAQGGGVLRDLSHELDAALWLLGPWRRVTALGGHVSGLETDADDCFQLLVEAERCPAVSIHVDCLRSPARRGFDLVGEGFAVRGDLIQGELETGDEVHRFDCGRDDTYRAQLAAALRAADGGDPGVLCTLDEALDTLRLIEAAERAAQLVDDGGCWEARP